jgi:hypothetical protein
MGTIPIYITDGFIRYNTEASSPAGLELNWIFTIRNINTFVTPVDIELTKVPAMFEITNHSLQTAPALCDS